MDELVLAKVRARLDKVAGLGLDAAQLEDEAVELAAELLTLARSERRRSEAAAEARLSRMMEDESGRLLTLAFTDQALRAKRPERVADQLRHLLTLHGVPRYFSAWERLQLGAFKTFGGAFPKWLVPKVLARLRYEVRQVSLPAGGEALDRALAQRAALGIAVNLNHLGEAILGEDEARARHAVYLRTLERPDIEAVSVKVSSIASQINLLAWDDTLDVLEARVAELYRAAMQHPIAATPGTQARPKLVTLDMEEYRDLELTMALFERLMAHDELLPARAGIVLQAYLPDTHATQRRLVTLARERVARGGRPIHVRLVKGANLAMERVDAGIHGWPQAPYKTKAEVDANYKRLVMFGMQHADVAHIGVASHNVFDLAWAMVLRSARGGSGGVRFEMLEGIAAPLARVVAAVTGALMVYAPTADDRDLLAAIAYLIRRLDENTGPDNFLRASFGMEVGDDAFAAERDRFLAAVHARDDVAMGPRREHTRVDVPVSFVNAADSDWALPDRRAWITRAMAAFKNEPAPEVQLASLEAADAAIARARGWVPVARKQRQAWLRACAEGIEAARGELIAVMIAEAHKAIPEGDAEVSEAVDFARYYAQGLDEWATLEGQGVALTPRGVVLVTPPWNFPLAIPAGGVFAALAAGNAVLLKPAPETPRIALALCRICWAAGVPQDVLQLVPCANEPVGTHLVQHPAVDAIVLTGSTATARRFLELRDDRYLLAETGGKNATIVTEMADHDLAIKHVLHSAFSHAGQKCSATSLLILEAALYDDADFMRRLADAARSLPVGPAWRALSKVTPLIREPRGDLAWALAGGLDEGESWLVAPRALTPQLWTPGVKLGVKAGSRTYTNELFGPVLAVMRADDLEHALQLANGVAYGLTAGLQSLDDREIAHWKAGMDAGCLYVNRPTTGAIVLRQPFGGRKASVFGPGAKAGGPNYVLQLTHVREVAPREPDYALAFAEHFATAVDPVRLLGQDNFLRYQPLRAVVLRVEDPRNEHDIKRVQQAAAVCGTPLVMSEHESLEAMLARADEAKAERVRVVGPASAALRRACHRGGLHLADAPVVALGRIELLHYLKEQTVSEDYHRFGNLGVRDRETRTPIL